MLTYFDEDCYLNDTEIYKSIMAHNKSFSIKYLEVKTAA